MSTLVVYESMYGNTRQLAEAIAGELTGARAVPVWGMSGADVAAADTVIIGGPTHAFGMSRPATRVQADVAARRTAGLICEAPVDADGLREWLAHADLTGKRVAVFDTRVRTPLPHAARQILRAARRAGGDLVAPAESFLVSKANVLHSAELDRARRWAQSLPSVRSGQDVGP